MQVLVSMVRRRVAFVVGLALVAALLAGLIDNWGRALVTPVTPLGQVSLQLAGSSIPAAWMLEAWDAEPALARRAKAGVALGLDFAFIPVYVLLLAFLCLWAASALPPGPLRTIGPLAAIGVVAAGVFDIVENTAVLMMLFSSVDPPWPQIARVCALLKFGLIAAGALYAAVIWVVITVPALIPARRPA